MPPSYSRSESITWQLITKLVTRILNRFFFVTGFVRIYVIQEQQQVFFLYSLTSFFALKIIV